MAGVGLLALLVYSMWPQPLEVDLAVIGQGPLQVTIVEDGKTRIKERYIISAPLAGRLLRIQWKPGDAVEIGSSPIIVMEPSDPALLDARQIAEAEARVQATESAVQRVQTDLERQRLALEQSEKELGRRQRLVETDAVSQADLEEAWLDYRSTSELYRAAQFSESIARYELQLAQAALLQSKPSDPDAPPSNRFEIDSPITGRVLRVFQESANIVTPGTPLIEVGDPTDLELEIDVLSTDAVKIRPGAKVLVEHWGGDQPLAARVRIVEPAAFTKVSALGVEEQRVNVIADFVDPPDQRRALGDGYRVEAQIVVWESEDVIKVPSGALFRRGQDWAVFVVVDGRAQTQIVQLGQNNDLEAVVLEGLEVDDQIILYPGDKITDNARVVPR